MVDKYMARTYLLVDKYGENLSASLGASIPPVGLIL